MSVAIHPGEVLMEDFIGPLGTTQHASAIAIKVPPRRINEIVHGKRAVTADTALRFSRALGTSAEFWINLQTRFDLIVAETRAKDLDGIAPLPQVTAA